MARNPDCKIIAITNQKGGVGKTTTAVNLATALAAVGKHTLFIDLDPQGNGSTGFGIAPNNRTPNIYDVLLNDTTLADAEQETFIPCLSIIPATIDLSATDVELATAERREYVLKTAIEACDTYYNYIVIDCPPSLGLLTVNALTAATSVLIPLQCEFYALEGLTHLLGTIERVQRKLNPHLQIGGVVLTMYDNRNNLSSEVEADVRGYLGNKVLRTTIPRNVRVSEAPSHGKPAIIYDHRSSGAQAYLHLAKEILKQ